MRCATSLAAVLIGVAGACSAGVSADATAARAQVGRGETPTAPQAREAEPWRDPLGRSTPRGTVTGFLDAARAANNELSAQYLDAAAARAQTLAAQLFVVLDERLRGRFIRISDEPEGSAGAALPQPREVVGTVESSKGQLKIELERVSRGDPGPVWVFSQRTLEAIPGLHAEIVAARKEVLPRFLVGRRLAGIRVVDYLAVLLGLPLAYLITVLLNRALTPVIRVLWRRLSPGSETIARNVLPAPARLLLVTLVGSWLVSELPLSLAMRQLSWTVAGLVAIGAVAWLLILLNGEVERHMSRGVQPSNVAAASSLLRLLRRTVDVFILFVAMFVMLRRLGIDPTPALAGLGVGGIAVALAAQKTLENVIAGASLIFDQAVRVGDFLKMGDVVGTIDHIGLRSTRIRTLDRSIVSVPNSQIANASLETLSSRDKFWFHPTVALRYETTAEQLRGVVDGITRMLKEHPAVEPGSVRVRFVRLGAFSLDIEVFAYLTARDWNAFLEDQEQLLFKVTDIVGRAGTSIAFPPQSAASGTLSLR